MDAIWECLNFATRLSKIIDLSENWVPKSQKGAVNPVSDLQEFHSTLNCVRQTLVPLAASSKKSKVATEATFEVCIKGIHSALVDTHQYFKDLEKEFSVFTWKTQKVKVYQKDFELRQKLDQFLALFSSELQNQESSKPIVGPNLIQDNEGKEMWNKSFGDSTAMVAWNVFFPALEAYLRSSFKEDEEFIKFYLNFTKTDYVSCYEFAVFLRMFGPLTGSITRLMDSLKQGLLCGFVPAVEANLLLEGKKEGTFLIRCSKTQPGSFAVTFMDNIQKVRHSLLYAILPSGLTLKNPPTVYSSLAEFAKAHVDKLKHPFGNKYTLSKGLPGFGYIPTTDKNEEKTKQDSQCCVVCMDAPYETVFLECGHMACCQHCSGMLKQCPICRLVITRIIPVFRAS